METFEVPGGTVRYAAWGSGTAPSRLVMLHASSTGPRSFNRLGGLLAEQGLSVVAPALNGYEGTSWPGDSVSANRAIAAAALARHRPEDTVLFGHSMGGLIALLAALDSWQAGRRLKGLILFEPILLDMLDHTVPEEKAAWDWDRAIIAKLQTKVAAGDPEGGVRTFVEAWNETDWTALPEAARRQLIAMAPNLLAECEAVGPLQLDCPALQAMTTPTLALHGANGPAMTRFAATNLATLLPNATAAAIPDTGHMAPLLSPDNVAEVLRTFIQG